MIKVPEDIIREFPINKGTDRDVELVVLMEYLQSLAPIESILDLGAHFSTYNEYAEKIRPLAKRYDGVDILLDEEVKKIVDNFYVGNACDIELPKYDVVVCISSIEHSGTSTYKVTNVKQEQNRLFKKCLELANKYVWVSVPTGLEYVYPNELSIITEDQIKLWEQWVKEGGWKLKMRYFISQGPQSKHPWYEHNKRRVAMNNLYIDYIGNQNITVLEIDKT